MWLRIIRNKQFLTSSDLRDLFLEKYNLVEINYDKYNIYPFSEDIEIKSSTIIGKMSDLFISAIMEQNTENKMIFPSSSNNHFYQDNGLYRSIQLFGPITDFYIFEDDSGDLRIDAIILNRKLKSVKIKDLKFIEWYKISENKKKIEKGNSINEKNEIFLSVGITRRFVDTGEYVIIVSGIFVRSSKKWII